MKQGLSSLVDLAKEIERQNDEKQDYMADTRSMSLSANGSIHLNMEGTNGDTMMLPVNATAARQMGDKVGIPAKYFDKMKENAPELLATNAK